MKKEHLPERNAIIIAITLIIGNNIILGFPADVGQDTWISLLISMLLMIPVALMYARMMRLMPGMDLYEMAEYALGKFGGRIVALLFGFFCLHISALVLGSYVQFIHLTSLFHTPVMVTTLLIMFTCLYLARSGVETLGKWCFVMIVITAATLVLFFSLSFGTLKPERLQPVYSHSLESILFTAVKLVPLPFGESVVMLALVGGLEKKANSYRIWTWSTVLSTVFLVIVFIRSCTMLGVNLMNTVYFPTYKAASIIKIGSYLERIEAFLAFIYILAGISKTAANMIAASKGAARLFGAPSYHPLVLPVCFLAAAMSLILFDSMVEMFDFIFVYLVYAPPFQFGIPLLVWIAAEVRFRRSATKPTGDISSPVGQRS